MIALNPISGTQQIKHGEVKDFLERIFSEFIGTEKNKYTKEYFTSVLKSMAFSAHQFAQAQKQPEANWDYVLNILLGAVVNQKIFAIMEMPLPVLIPSRPVGNIHTYMPESAQEMADFFIAYIQYFENEPQKWENQNIVDFWEVLDTLISYTYHNDHLTWKDISRLFLTATVQE